MARTFAAIARPAFYKSSDRSLRTLTAFRCGTPLRAATAGLLLLMGLGGCAHDNAGTPSAAVTDPNNDPLEPVNRKILDVNQFVDRILLKPVARAYIAVLPEDGRNAIRRVLDNMKEPTVFINNVLQGEFARAGVSLGRFTLNTSAGMGGVFDVAAKWGLEEQPADFGQTLFVWGLPEGPYLIIPILGPSNPRDAIGMTVDSYADPFTMLANARGVEELTISRFATNGIDQRARVIDVLDELEKNSLDFYAELRSLSQQKRAAELRPGAPLKPDGDFYNDPGKPAGAAPPSAAPGSGVSPPTPLTGTAPTGPAPGGVAAPAAGSGPPLSIRAETDPDEGPLLAAPAGSARP